MSGRFNQASYLHASQDGIIEFVPPVVFDGSAGASISGGSTSVPIWCKDVDAWGITWATSGASTLVGSIGIQATCERGNIEQNGRPDATLTDWTTIAFLDKTSTTPGTLVTTKAVASGANSILIADMSAAYRWMRLVFTYTSGAGAPRVTFQQKGYP